MCGYPEQNFVSLLSPPAFGKTMKSSSDLTAAWPPGAGESRGRHPLQQLSRGAGKEEFPFGNRLQRITWLLRNMRLKTAWFSPFLHMCTYREAINWLLRRLGTDHLESETQSHCSSQTAGRGKEEFCALHSLSVLANFDLQWEVSPCSILAARRRLKRAALQMSFMCQHFSSCGNQLRECSQGKRSKNEQLMFTADDKFCASY